MNVFYISGRKILSEKLNGKDYSQLLREKLKKGLYIVNLESTLFTKTIKTLL